MNSESLVRFFSDYQTSYTDEALFIPRFLELQKQTNCFDRTHLPGHITGSAWIVDPSNTQALLVHHAKLNKWVQPGGHADGDENILQVALREAEEETGLKKLRVVNDTPFDVDIHLIPKRADFPEHFHFDIRYLLEASMSDQIIVSNESHDVKWITLDTLEDYNPERSVIRMKIKSLRANQQ
ncbi:MAG: NUDIX hydrolase [Flammeovirgaceae bacterium]|nr:NUDIX hydrolase [Flammeovirgaceae bacterium]